MMRFVLLVLVAVIPASGFADEVERSKLTRAQAQAIVDKIPGGPDYNFKSKEWEAIEVLSGVVLAADEIAPEDAEPEDLRPDIVMYVPDFKCEACTTWQLNTMKALLKQGHRVLILQKLKLPKYPTFRVLRTDGTWSPNRDSGMTVDQYRSIVSGKL